jgi:hypothetical protein
MHYHNRRSRLQADDDFAALAELLRLILVLIFKPYLYSAVGGWR